MAAPRTTETKGKTRSAVTVKSSSPDHDPEKHDADGVCLAGCPAYRLTDAHQAPAEEMWTRLARPFPSEDIEKLPRNLKSRDDDKGRCEEGSRYSADGYACHGWHARSIHLDYVGHAGITMRLNEVLGPQGWDFQPYALSPEGLPLMSTATYWARLTIAGVTKADLAANFSGPQEAYGDALRRCAMRFGIGTYLWSKSERALEMAKANDVEADPPNPEPQTQAAPEPTMTAAQFRLSGTLAELTEAQRTTLRGMWASAGLPSLHTLSDEHVATVEGMIRGMLSPDPQ